MTPISVGLTIDKETTLSEFTEILEKLSDIRVEQGIQSEKQKATHNIVVKLETKVGEQNGRIGKLEGWRNRIAGAVALLVVLVGYWMKWG